MTPAQIQAAARRKYNATGDTFFSDDEFFYLIYEAESVLAQESLVIQKTYTTSSVASQREYAWPTNALGIRRIEYDGSKLKFINMRQDDIVTLLNTDVVDTGTPEYYFVWDRSIFLRKTPGTAGLSIKIYTYDLPSLQTSSSANLDTPVIYHKDIVNFVVANMAIKDGNGTIYDRFNKMWELAVANSRKFQRRRVGQDGMPRVQNVDALVNTNLGYA